MTTIYNGNDPASVEILCTENQWCLCTFTTTKLEHWYNDWLNIFSTKCINFVSKLNTHFANIEIFTAVISIQ